MTSSNEVPHYASTYSSVHLLITPYEVHILINTFCNRFEIRFLALAGKKKGWTFSLRGWA
jgi:hypothetical protein